MSGEGRCAQRRSAENAKHMPLLTNMKTRRLTRSLALAALALSLTLTGVAAGGLTDAALRDHVDAQVPAYLKIRSLNTKVLGNPALKVKAELELEAAETLYAESAQGPALKSVATELTGDLRAEQPKPLRLLKVVTREGAVTKRLNFDFTVTVTTEGATLGSINPRLFESFGRPRTDFAAEAVAEDTAEGGRALAVFAAEVKNYNDAVAKLDRRAGTDRMLKNSTSVVDRGLTIYEKVTGQGGSGAPDKGPGSGLREAFGTLTGLVNGHAPTNSPTDATVPAATPTPVAKPVGNPFGQLLNHLPAQFTLSR